MTALSPPIVIRAELPTPDIVVVQTSDGASLMFADQNLDQAEIDLALRNIGAILNGPAHPMNEPLR